MIEKIHLKYFKQFKEQSFELSTSIVLAGPNNSGKTTLLQAIATWYFTLREWKQKTILAHNRKTRSGVRLLRKEFLSVPMQRFNLLWTGSSTSLKKDEGGGKGAATPRILKITLEGKNDETQNPWQKTMEFRYDNSELVYAKPSDEAESFDEKMDVVYIPSFSGIETEEKVHTREYQEWLIGQGKPGDIIRNLMVEVSNIEVNWRKLSEDVKKIFGYRLLKPEHKGRPFILCEYLPGIPPKGGRGGLPKLDIACAGSGFLQTLLLLSFFYARPSTVLLIDELDAHLHVVLQKQIYDHLKEVAQERQCQVIIATHSEVIIDNTSPGNILSFYGTPHRLEDKDRVKRDQIREGLKRLTSMDILQSDGKKILNEKKILYVESDTDFDILRIWSEKLNHKLKEWFSAPYYHLNETNHPKETKAHFFCPESHFSRDVRCIVAR